MSQLRLFLRSVFCRTRLNQELDEELQYHLEREIQEGLKRGLAFEEAQHAARRAMGAITQNMERCRDVRRLNLLDDLSRDLRYGLRMLRHNPMFTATALLTLGIGIGANVAVFSVVNSVLLRPLPYPQSDQLVGVVHNAPGASGLGDVLGELPLSASMYFTYAEQNRTFQALGVWIVYAQTVTGVAEPEQVRSVFVSDGVLEGLMVPPLLGRWIAHDDQIPVAGNPNTFTGGQNVMLGFGYWQRRFGGDPSVIGQSVTVDSRPRQIVGVMPKGFRVVTADPDLIVPFAFNRSRLTLPGFGFQGVGRLRSGVTLAQANADIARMVPIWMNSWPAAPGINPHIYGTWRIAPAARLLKQTVVRTVGNVLWVVMATIGVVMLIVCANVANLLLVRAEARQQELGIRAALGAGWGRIVQEFLTETILLGVLGGVAGIGIAYGGLRLLVSFGPSDLPRLSEISVDERALGFALALSILSGLFFGMIPAFKFAGHRIVLGGRAFSATRERHRARNTLVVAQVALALILLVSSGLMIRTFQALSAVDAGFIKPEQLQTVRVSIPLPLVPQTERVARLQHDIVDKLSAIPGVSSAAFTSDVPMEGGGVDWDCVRKEGVSYAAGEIPALRVYKYVSPGVFQTMGTRIIAGRDITWTDFHDRRPVAIVSENLARDLWGSPNSAPGKRISACLPTAPWREVIGVVRDVRNNGVQQPAPAIVYWPSFMEGLYRSGRPTLIRDVRFVIRSDRAGSESVLKQIQQAVWSVNGNLPLASVHTMKEFYSQSLARTSFTLVMLAIAGSMAMLLGIIGIYGVISYAVSQRRREIGIRLALGAQQSQLKTMFVRQALLLTGIGVAVGLGAAVGLTRLMSSLLFGISPLDPVTYSAVPVILALAATTASYLPALQASAVDPVEALRGE